MDFLNKKQTYCPHMYVGFQGRHTDYSLLCGKTNQDCIAYEETLISIKRENNGDEVKGRHWTETKPWRLDLNIIRRCPSNSKRNSFSLLEEREIEIEEEFFGAALSPS